MGKRGHVHWDRSLERIKGFSTKALLAGPSFRLCTVQRGDLLLWEGSPLD